MEKPDFNYMYHVLSGETGIDATQKQYQFEYWEKRVLGRIDYLTPLIQECKKKGVDLITLSKELYNEWIELHTCVDYYGFKWCMPEGLDTEEKHEQYLKDIGAK